MSKILKTLSMNGNLYDVSGKLRYFLFSNNRLTEFEGIHYNADTQNIDLIASESTLKSIENANELAANLMGSINRIYYVSDGSYCECRDLAYIATMTMNGSTTATAKSSTGTTYTISALDYIPHPQESSELL